MTMKISGVQDHYSLGIDLSVGDVDIRRSFAAEQNSAHGFVPYYIDTVRRCRDDDQCVVVMTI
jgi:hypothetical protein